MRHGFIVIKYNQIQLKNECEKVSFVTYFKV